MPPAQMACADTGTFSGQELARVLEGGGLVAIGTHVTVTYADYEQSFSGAYVSETTR